MKLLISFSLFLFLNFSFVVSNDNSTKLTFKVEPIGFHHSILGEGPHWDEKKQVLYHVDIPGGAVWKIDLKNNHSESVHLGDLVSVVIPFADSDDLLVSRRNKIGRLNWASKNFTVIAEVAPELKGKERFNDAKVDAKGRLWIGTIRDDEHGIMVGGGGFYRLDHKNFTKVSGNFTITNGMGWSKDNKKLYLNDSEDRKTWVFDFDLEKGTISNRRILIDSTKHPSFQKGWDQDGMTVDQNGKIWTALYGGGRVFQINPENAAVENVIKLPAVQTTSVFFGGPNYDQLFVTTGNGSIPDADRPKFPDAGKVFRVTANSALFKGQGAGNRFKQQ